MTSQSNPNANTIVGIENLTQQQLAAAASGNTVTTSRVSHIHNHGLHSLHNRNINDIDAGYQNADSQSNGSQDTHSVGGGRRRERSKADGNDNNNNNNNNNNNKNNGISPMSMRFRTPFSQTHGMASTEYYSEGGSPFLQQRTIA